MYPTADKLRKHFKENDTIQFEGLELRRSHSSLEPGNTYIAGRNGDIKLLTVLYIKDEVVFNTEREYPFSVWECYKVDIEESV